MVTWYRDVSLHGRMARRAAGKVGSARWHPVFGGHAGECLEANHMPRHLRHVGAQMQVSHRARDMRAENSYSAAARLPSSASCLFSRHTPAASPRRLYTQGTGSTRCFAPSVAVGYGGRPASAGHTSLRRQHAMEDPNGGGGSLCGVPQLAHAPEQPGGVLGRAQPGNSAVRALPSDAWFSGPLPSPDLLPSHCCGTDTAKRAHLEQRLSQPGAALVRQFETFVAPPAHAGWPRTAPLLTSRTLSATRRCWWTPWRRTSPSSTVR